MKMPSTAFSSEEVIRSNVIQSAISTYHPWHWLLAACTNIAISSGTQDYSMAAGDQNTVQAIYDANLLEGATEQPQLSISHICLPKTSTTGQPMGACLLNATSIRLWPTPDATYTFQWRKYVRPVVFTANSDSYQCPDNFENVIIAGSVWQLAELNDDDRAEIFKKHFYEQLDQLKVSEIRTIGRWKV